MRWDLYTANQRRTQVEEVVGGCNYVRTERNQAVPVAMALTGRLLGVLDFDLGQVAEGAEGN